MTYFFGTYEHSRAEARLSLRLEHAYNDERIEVGLFKLYGCLKFPDVDFNVSNSPSAFVGFKIQLPPNDAP